MRPGAVQGSWDWGCYCPQRGRGGLGEEYGRRQCGGACPGDVSHWAGRERALCPERSAARVPGPRSGMLRQPLSPCVAGERLCSTEEATAGSGTYTRHGFIFSSLAGCLERKSEDNEVSAAAARLLLPSAECRAPSLHGLPGDWAATGNWSLMGFGW